MWTVKISRHWEFGSDEKEREKGREKEKLKLRKEWPVRNNIWHDQNEDGGEKPKSLQKAKDSVGLSFEFSQVIQKAMDQI